MAKGRGLPLYPRFIGLLCRVGAHAIARVRVEGLQGLPTTGPLIIAANHLSNTDPPFIGGWLAPAIQRRPVFLAKEALFVGCMGPLLRSLGAEPVKAGGSDTAAFRVAKRVLEAGGVMAILPEGTRSRNGVLGKPKPGVAMLATRTGAPVLPVGISGTDKLMGPGQKFPHIGARVVLRVGKPFYLSVPPDSDRRASLAAADDELMRRIAALLEPRHRGDWEPWPDEEASPVRS